MSVRLRAARKIFGTSLAEAIGGTPVGNSIRAAKRYLRTIEDQLDYGLKAHAINMTRPQVKALARGVAYGNDYARGLVNSLVKFEKKERGGPPIMPTTRRIKKAVENADAAGSLARSRATASFKSPARGFGIGKARGPAGSEVVTGLDTAGR